MSSDPYLEERKILVNVYSAQVRAHSQNFLAIAVSMFSAVVAWVQIRSVEHQLGRGLIPGFNVATPFLLSSASVLVTLALYMVGRTSFWSYMTDSAVRVGPSPPSRDPTEEQKIRMTLGSLEDLSVNNVRKTHRCIYLFFKPRGSWGLSPWVGFSAILFLLGLTFFCYHSEWCPAYLVLISLMIVLEAVYWVKHYRRVFN